jgi:hypothetical protein
MSEIIVQIVDRETKEIIKEISCKSQRQADKVYDGASINLNHDKYFLQMTEK